jgi:hypothetical protein
MAHGGFGSGAHEAHQFDGGHELHDAASELGFQFGGGAEGEAVRGDFLDGFDHLGVCMAQYHGTPGTHIVDEASSIGGGHVGAGRLLEENGFAADAAKGTDRRVDAARYVFTGFLVKGHVRL